ncbi:LAGLIDADG family homing endonuclease [Candidatus Wolfebacteria bacterium]|nr:LAGLIDADG family homing endonuclease [Candidatus Wolfebacteria bacterium]
MKKLPGDYIAGFVDGEGCFALKFRRDVRHERKNQPVYFYWDIEFAITLRGDDLEILKDIQNTLECGKISININKRNMARFSVNKIEDLSDKIIPFFKQHHLRAKKKEDFKLWKEAVYIMYKNKGLATNISTTGNPRGKRKIFWPIEELLRLEKIHKEMKGYKSTRGEWKWINQIENLSVTK